MLTLIRQVECFCPKYIGRRDILVAGGKIYKIAKPGGIEKSALIEDIFDFSGSLALPGIIDQHVHIIGGGYKIMLDYAHNKSGYKEVINACKGIEHKRLIGVIGMPGDRTDHAISEVGALCAGSFDKIYIKEDKALRGRQKEEVALILKEAVINSGFPEDKVYTIPCEEEALKAAAKEADRGDLIVGFYEDFEPLDRLISKSLLH